MIHEVKLGIVNGRVNLGVGYLYAVGTQSQVGTYEN